MLRFASSTDFAIATAHIRGTLSLVEQTSRFGGTFVAITDDRGVIEVQDTVPAAKARVATVTEAGR